MLVLADLHCVRDERVLFERLNLVLSAGEALEIRGHNGCGKSSLLKIIAGLRAADAGQVRWHNQVIESAQDYQTELLYLGHQNALKPALSAAHNVQFWLQLSGQTADPHAVLAKVGLDGFQSTPVASLSAGQKRRVALARLLTSSARLWLLDEPFTALDVHAQRALQGLMQRRVETGGIVIFTTHQALDWSLQHRLLALTGGDSWQLS